MKFHLMMKLFINKLIKMNFNNEKYKYEKINFRGQYTNEYR